MDYLELKHSNTSSLQNLLPIQHLIDQQDFWIKVDEGHRKNDKYYQAKTGGKTKKDSHCKAKIAQQ